MCRQYSRIVRVKPVFSCFRNFPLLHILIISLSEETPAKKVTQIPSVSPFCAIGKIGYINTISSWNCTNPHITNFNVSSILLRLTLVKILWLLFNTLILLIFSWLSYSLSFGWDLGFILPLLWNLLPLSYIPGGSFIIQLLFLCSSSCESSGKAA